MYIYIYRNKMWYSPLNSAHPQPINYAQTL